MTCHNCKHCQIGICQEHRSDYYMKPMHEIDTCQYYYDIEIYKQHKRKESDEYNNT